MDDPLLEELLIFWAIFTAQRMKFSIKDFFSKCDQICSFSRIWSHLLKKSLMENFIFCAVIRLRHCKIIRICSFHNLCTWKQNFYYEENKQESRHRGQKPCEKRKRFHLKSHEKNSICFMCLMYYYYYYYYYLCISFNYVLLF